MPRELCQIVSGWRAVAVQAAVVLALLLPLRTAHALSCALGDPVWPTEHATDVPTNTLIWVMQSGDASADTGLRLLDDQDADVPFTSSLLQRGPWGIPIRVLQPEALLTVGGIYHVVTNDGRELGRFRVSLEEDIEPPSIPDVSILGYRVEQAWGLAAHAQLDIAPLANLLVFDTDGGAGLTTAPVSGSITTIELPSTPSIFGTDGLCHTNWAEATPGANAKLSVGTFDWAGNFSGFAEPVAIELPEQTAAMGDPPAAGRPPVPPPGSDQVDDPPAPTGDPDPAAPQQPQAAGSGGGQSETTGRHVETATACSAGGTGSPVGLSPVLLALCALRRRRN